VCVCVCACVVCVDCGLLAHAGGDACTPQARQSRQRLAFLLGQSEIFQHFMGDMAPEEAGEHGAAHAAGGGGGGGGAGGGGGGSGGAAAAGGGGGPMLALAKSPSKHRTLKGGDAKGAAAGGGGEEEDLLEGGDTWPARGLLWPQLILLFRPRGADNKIVRLTQQPPNIMGGQVRAGGGSARARPA
jgi:hypothetical protein